MPADLCVHRDGEILHLEPKSMAVLLELVQQPDQTVSREALHNAVWPRGYVSDDVLTRCISQLRRVFDDSPRESTYIATVPRRGTGIHRNTTSPSTGPESSDSGT